MSQKRHRYQAPNKHGQTPKTTKKVFIGGIPRGISAEEFRSYFKSFGAVAKLDLPVNKKKGVLKGFGFVTYASDSSVKHVLSISPHILNGKEIAVRPAMNVAVAAKETKKL